MQHSLERAFSLLETMIALAVLAIGLLGSARLFVAALQQLQLNAHHRSAVFLGEELAEQLIAAREVILHDNISECSFTRRPCFTDRGLEAQLNQWHARLRATLPDPVAEIARQDDSATIAWRINIGWLERSGQFQSQRFEFRLQR